MRNITVKHGKINLFSKVCNSHIVKNNIYSGYRLTEIKQIFLFNFLIFQFFFLGWLTKNSTELITAGHGEARCKFCKVSLRAHASDLKKHAGTGSHLSQAKLWNRKKQPSLISHSTSLSYYKITINFFFI